jgi:hypothetical protein
MLFNNDAPMCFDRAHRLGGIKKNAKHPRPVIVKFTFYRNKEHVLSQGYKLKGYREGMSEDFSKATLSEHKELAKYGKTAKDSNLIKGYRIKYRTISAQHVNPRDVEKTFNKAYSLQFIKKNPDNWHTYTGRDAKTI